VKKRRKHAKRTEREDTHKRRENDLCHPLTITPIIIFEIFFIDSKRISALHLRFINNIE
jgi:hypothetical protein